MARCILRKKRKGYNDKFPVYVCLRYDRQCIRGSFCKTTQNIRQIVTDELKRD